MLKLFINLRNSIKYTRIFTEVNINDFTSLYTVEAIIGFRSFNHGHIIKEILCVVQH